MCLAHGFILSNLIAKLDEVVTLKLVQKFDGQNDISSKC